MQLTSRQIIERKIISNFCEQGIQQQGIDVRLKKVYKYASGHGSVLSQGKTKKMNFEELQPVDNIFFLYPGYYEIEFEEGCDIPSDIVLNFKTRSSLVRNGALVYSGQFDAGFKTDNMGAFLQVINGIEIEKGARVAQAVCTETYNVSTEDLYNGQWQGDNQRKQ